MSNSLQELKLALNGSVATENDANYDISRWANNTIRKAKYVVCPMDAQDVSKAIQFARADGLDLAIRGGGYSTSGASSSNGGLVINLSKNLNGVRIDAERKLVYAQGGALWKTVDAEATKHGLASCAGNVGYSGVGGLTVGGGYGYKVGTHGLVMDNLVEATVVIASGEIVIANEREHQDLFWGIRGGGSNFGVVTEFVFKLHEQRRDVYKSILVFLPPKLAVVSNELMEWTKTQPSHQSISLVFTSCPENSPVILCACFSNSDEVEGAAAFKRFVDLGPVANMTSQVPYVELNQFMGSNSGLNRLYRGVRIPNFSAALSQSVFDARLKLVTDHPETVAHTSIVWEFCNYEKVASVAPDATAFADRTKNINVQVGMGWEGDSFSPSAKEEFHKLTSVIASKAPDANNNVAGYANYDDTEALDAPENISKNVYGINYPRLQLIKKKYDPGMLFNKWFLIRPAE